MPEMDGHRFMDLPVQQHLAPSVYHLVKERQLNSRSYASQFYLYSKRASTQLYHHFRGAVELGGLGSALGLEYSDSPYGAVFNLEFSPIEDLVIAVCANRAILVYDPRTSSRVSVVPHGHEDCVNCVTFLDNFTFATCSDDHTIRVWDMRSLRGSRAVLSGHTNWVKNIEYDKKSETLFSVAFHDGVRAWDINKLDSYSEEETDNQVLKFHDPVRMRISPDGSKMFVSTRKNLCLVIDRFDGKHVHEITASVESLMQAPTSKKTTQQLKQRKTNRPSLHVMSGLSGTESYRAVMSAAFHSSGFLGLRHIDVTKGKVRQELTTLYDVRNTDDNYAPYLTVEKCQENYRKYVDEDSPSDALNFIKEISFSRDGRVLASPYENGVRLLAMDSLCTSADEYFDDQFHSMEKSLCSFEFEELGVCYGHTAPVLACRFAHNDCLLATGCLAGKVKFHYPQL